MVNSGLAFIAFLFLLVFVFDISFNLRRLLKNLDRIWRKLTEINDSLQKRF